MTLSLAMDFFYFQGICQEILQRQFEQEHLQPIANVIRLEFPGSRKSLEESGAPVDYPWLRRMLRSDFHALTCLLKNATNLNRHGSAEERLLACLLYTSPSPRDPKTSRMPSSA